MADRRNIDDRSKFFEDAAKSRTQVHRLRPRKGMMGWQESERLRRRDVGEKLHDAAADNKECIISYTKITEDYATRIWTIEPYSYRYRWLTGGGRWDPSILKKVLFGYDVLEDTIKMFMYGNIHDVTITETTYSPRWRVEITYTPPIGPIAPYGPSVPED